MMDVVDSSAPLRARVFTVVVLVVAVGAVAPVEGANVRRVLRTAPTLVGLPGLAADERYHNAADVILESAIRNLPLFPAASSAFTWRWNPETHAIERVSDAVSPWFVTERGQTLGEGLLNVDMTFGHYKVECSSGCRIGTDPFPLAVSVAAIQYQAPTELTYSVG